MLVLYTWKVDAPPADAPSYAKGEDEEESRFGEGFKSSGTWVVTIAGTLFTFCCFGFANDTAIRAQTFFGGDMGQSNWWVSVMYAIEIPVVILIGWLLNHIRIGRRRFVGVVGFVLYAFILLLCFRMKDPALLLPFILIYPFLKASYPTCTGRCVRRRPRSPSTLARPSAF